MKILKELWGAKFCLMKYEFWKSGKLFKVIATVIMPHCAEFYGQNYSVLFGVWPEDF